MKAIILAAGLGSRFTSSIETQEGQPATPLHKCLAKVGDRRILDFSLDTAVDLGVNEIVVVVGHMAETIRDAYGSDYRGAPLTYAYQTEPLGLIDALSCGRDALGEADFWLFLGDEILIDADHHKMQSNFYQSNASISCGAIPTDDPERIRKNYTLSFDPDSGLIRRVVEKPVQLLSPYIGTGNCLFRNDTLHYIDQMPTDPGTGKKELAGLIQYTIDAGDAVLCHKFEAIYHYVNLNTFQDYLSLQTILKKRAG